MTISANVGYKIISTNVSNDSYPHWDGIGGKEYKGHSEHPEFPDPEKYYYINVDTSMATSRITVPFKAENIVAGNIILHYGKHYECIKTMDLAFKNIELNGGKLKYKGYRKTTRKTRIPAIEVGNDNPNISYELDGKFYQVKDIIEGHTILNQRLCQTVSTYLVVRHVLDDGEVVEYLELIRISTLRDICGYIPDVFRHQETQSIVSENEHTIHTYKEQRRANLPSIMDETWFTPLKMYEIEAQEIGYLPSARIYTDDARNYNAVQKNQHINYTIKPNAPIDNITFGAVTGSQIKVTRGGEEITEVNFDADSNVTINFPNSSDEPIQIIIYIIPNKYASIGTILTGENVNIGGITTKSKYDVEDTAIMHTTKGVSTYIPGAFVFNYSNTVHIPNDCENHEARVREALANIKKVSTGMSASHIDETTKEVIIGYITFSDIIINDEEIVMPFHIRSII